MSADQKHVKGRTSLSPSRYVSPAVALMILLLFGSAGLRLASGAGQALANGSGEAAAATLNIPAQEEAVFCPTDDEINEILARLQEREARLTRREGDLARRETTVKSAEARLSQRINELKDVEARLTQSMAKTATAAKDDVATLVAVYAAMKPKDAATLFEAMEPEFAAEFLRQMRVDAAAAIFAGLSPTHAYAVSAVLAGRNASVPIPPAAPASGGAQEADHG